MRTVRQLWAAGLLAVAAASAASQPLDYHLKARQLAPDTWVIEGANADFSPKNGCNIINTGFIATSAGTWVINTGPSRRYGEQQRKLVEKTAGKPVVGVINLNLHPDYFFGNQAWSGVKTYALAGTREGATREGPSYADNLYKICGDWMSGTESTPATETVSPGVVRWGDHEIELKRLKGHTADDLVLIDRTTGVVFAGGLVFAHRAPTTPHAAIPDWLASLDELERIVAALPAKQVIPSHGPVDGGRAGFNDTRRYLTWLDRQFGQSANGGLDIAEVLHQPIPDEFRSYSAADAEYPRSVFHLYPLYEKKALGGDPK